MSEKIYTRKGRRFDLTGMTFGKWHVQEMLPSTKYQHGPWKCKCDCGTVLIIPASYLTTKQTTQCNKCRNTGYNLKARKRPYEWLYNRFRNRAKKENHTVSLSYEDFT